MCARRRVRLAHSKAYNALDESTYAAGTPPPNAPLTAWPENSERAGGAPGSAGPAGSSGAAQLATMQREQMRMAWDLSVLRRAIPELEATAAQSGRMADGFRSQQQSYAKGRLEGDLALDELRTQLAHSRDEASALRARNADLERELASLRRASMSVELAPRTPQTGRSHPDM